MGFMVVGGDGPCDGVHGCEIPSLQLAARAALHGVCTPWMEGASHQQH